MNKGSEETEEVGIPVVEEEDTLSIDSSIEEPFNPSDVSFSLRQMTLDLLFSRLRHEEIDLKTFFQRKKDLWNPIQQSRLIESLLIRLPLPTFYFDGSDDNNWLIIDGLQRLSTFKSFVIDKTLKLQALEYLKQFVGYSFDDLPRDLQRRINETEVTVYILNPGTPPQVKFNIFRRINTGGIILTPQEIRHALNQGTPVIFVNELAESEEFRNATCYSIKTDRMEDRDFVMRFIGFYINPYNKYKPDLDSFLNRSMSELKEMSDEARNRIKEDFKKAMRLAIDIFGDDAFRKRNRLEDSRKPINKALFETWSVALSKLSKEEAEKINKNKDLVKELFIKKMNNEQGFLRSLSSGTGDYENVVKRFEVINSIVKEIIK